MCLDFGQTLPLLDLLHDPRDGFAQGLTEHGPTGFADGRQACVSPFLRTVLPQLAHHPEGTRRCTPGTRDTYAWSGPRHS